MTMPHRAAALALCLLALAASASAACTPGFFQIDLQGPVASTNPIAKCLTSVKISLDIDCTVTFSPISAGGVFVDGIWKTATGAATATYQQLVECPVEPTVSSANANAAAIKTAIDTAFEDFIYGSGKKVAVTIAYTADGVITVTQGTEDLVYAVTESTIVAAELDAKVIAVAATAGSLGTTGSSTTFFADNDIETACHATRYGKMVGAIKVCLLCPAGTQGDGNGCTGCAPGSASSAVGGSCTTCTTAGYYASGGTSDCLACPAGTYSDSNTGVAECTECPSDSYSWIPGSATCLRCIDGVPHEVTAGTTGLDPSTPGNQILALTDTSDPGCGLPQKPLWYGKCTMTGAGVKLSLRVAGDCSIDIIPVSGAECSEEGADGVVGTYAFTSMHVTAYYQTTTEIRSLLPATEAVGTTSYLLSLKPSGNADDLQTLTMWQATSLPGATLDATVCTIPLDTKGGQVNLIPTAGPITSCPAGSYARVQDYDVLEPNAVQYCMACPVGFFCEGGIKEKTACPAGTANPYLGQSSLSACLACSGTTYPGTSKYDYTSDEGAAYCTVKAMNTQCITDAVAGTDYSDGRQWDAASQSCVKCPAGTYRPSVTGKASSVALECVACIAGKYSGVGALGDAACQACPLGQYNPSEGLGDQELTGAPAGEHCLICPEGSLALEDGNTALTATASTFTAQTTGATFCDACPAGKIAPQTPTAGGTACAACQQFYYRSGDAAPGNNVCKRVPAGYKEVGTGRIEIGLCGKGTVSFWKAGTPDKRIPQSASTNCIACEDLDGDTDLALVNPAYAHTYAPREGMSKCIPCKGGFVPVKSDPVNSKGKDMCTACPDAEYRNAYAVRSDCIPCLAGGEVGPSNKQACTQCLPGSYMTTAQRAAGNNFCTDCPPNTFMPTPGSKGTDLGGQFCTNCPRGYETQDAGNIECSPCAKGYFNSVAGTVCDVAPIGTFVNTTAAVVFTPCPIGTFVDEVASDTCGACAPGTYANSRGSQACKTCPVGTFSSGQASTCKACPIGFFANAGSGACSPCKPGTFASQKRSGTCELCKRGYQCPTNAMSAPTGCPIGYFSNKDGRKICTPCPVNTYSTLQGLYTTSVGTAKPITSCKPCGANTSTRGLTGQSLCQTVRPQALRRSML